MENKFASKTYREHYSFKKFTFRFYIPEIRVSQLPEIACAAFEELNSALLPASGNPTDAPSAWWLGSNRFGTYLSVNVPSHRVPCFEILLGLGYRESK